MKKNTLVLTYWSYRDALIQTYTLPYVRLIKKYLSDHSKIFLITLEQPHLKMTKREWVVEKNKLNREGIILMRFKYRKFGFCAMIFLAGIFVFLSFLIFFKKVNKIHVWAMPAGVLGYLLSIITRKPLIIDSYEPHAESMIENGTWNRKSLVFNIA